jgi:hypothetical protein
MTRTVGARAGVASRARALLLLGAGAACIALLALGATDAHAALDFSTAFGGQGAGDQRFTTVTSQAPGVESEGVANVTAVAATLQASVNPEFADTHYYFEYGSTTAYGSKAPSPPGTDVGESGSAQSAAATISGLNPSATYHFRVVAVNSLGTTYGPDATLTTGPPMTIEGQSVANVTATAADLTAQIETEDLATNYQFEYGTTPAYGMQAPLPEAALAAATGTQRIAVHVESLQPNTTYYFRLVATNALGTVTASAAKFTTYPPGEAFSLPDNRAYELVSPVDKNGGDVGGNEGSKDGLSPPPSAFGESSTSGGEITYASATSFGDAQSAPGFSTQYLSTRGPSGWTTHAISPPASLPEHVELVQEPFHLFTTELTAWIFSWKDPPLAQGAPPQIENLYLGEAGGGAYQLIDNGTPAEAGNEGYNVKAVGASSDLRHVVFEADEALTPGATKGAQSVYEWASGALRLVSVLPGPGEVAAASGYGGAGERNMLPSVVSADGSRIFWIDGNNQLYVREDATTTVQLNASQRTPSLGDGTARMVAATPDGSRVFFIDETALTNAAGDNGGLYEYSFADNRLTDLTPDVSGYPGAEGVAGIGEDGASVYFIATASLTSKTRPGAGQPSPGEQNLYLARDGALIFIATLSSADGGDWTSSFDEHAARVTGDGDQLAFVSQAQLTGYDNSDLNSGDPDAEVFLYDAVAETLRCVSCNPSGERPIGPASVPTAQQTGHQPRYLSEDGQRVFFDSKDALLPAASNGKQNVYEYENGAIHLISSGTSDEDSTLVDASADGDDVFFTTRAQLVPEDQDENSDMYDARVDGGFPASASPAPCSGEGCRAPVSSPPAPVTIVTEEAHGAETLPVQPADLPVSKHKKAKKPRHKANARPSAHRARRSRRHHGGRRAERGRQKTAARHSLKAGAHAAVREGDAK